MWPLQALREPEKLSPHLTSWASVRSGARLPPRWAVTSLTPQPRSGNLGAYLAPVPIPTSEGTLASGPRG